MATIRELIVQKALLKLNTGTPGGVPQTERARTFALETSQLMSSIIYPVRNPVAEGSRPLRSPAIQTEVHLSIELRGKGDGVNSPDALLDPAINWVVKALCGTFEAGLWTDVEYDDTTFEWDQLDYAFCLATVKLRVLTQMKTNDPSAIA